MWGGDTRRRTHPGLPFTIVREEQGARVYRTQEGVLIGPPKWVAPSSPQGETAAALRRGEGPGAGLSAHPAASASAYTVGRSGGGAAPLRPGAGPAAPPPGGRFGARPRVPRFNWGCQAAARAKGRAGRRPGGRGGGRAARREAGAQRRGWGPRGPGAVPGQGCPAPAPGHPRSP